MAAMAVKDPQIARLAFILPVLIFFAPPGIFADFLNLYRKSTA